MLFSSMVNVPSPIIIIKNLCHKYKVITVDVVFRIIVTRGQRDPRLFNQSWWTLMARVAAYINAAIEQFIPSLTYVSSMSFDKTNKNGIKFQSEYRLK